MRLFLACSCLATKFKVKQTGDFHHKGTAKNNCHENVSNTMIYVT